MVARLCQAVSALGGQAESLAAKGNRKALIRHHRMQLQALAVLLAGANPTEIDPLASRVQAPRTTYRNADDLPGAANCSVTFAILAAAARDRASAHTLLAEARDLYSKWPGSSQPARH